VARSRGRRDELLRPTLILQFAIMLAPARTSKGSSTINIEDQTVLHALQQCPLNDPLNLEDADGFSIYRVSLNDSLSI
jgi:hypothetical protein